MLGTEQEDDSGTPKSREGTPTATEPAPSQGLNNFVPSKTVPAKRTMAVSKSLPKLELSLNPPSSRLGSAPEIDKYRVVKHGFSLRPLGRAAFRHAMAMPSQSPAMIAAADVNADTRKMAPTIVEREDKKPTKDRKQKRVVQATKLLKPVKIQRPTITDLRPDPPGDCKTSKV